MNITDQIRFTVYLTPQLREEASKQAKKRRQSTTQYLSMILEEQINERKEDIQE